MTREELLERLDPPAIEKRAGFFVRLRANRPSSPQLLKTGQYALVQAGDGHYIIPMQDYRNYKQFRSIFKPGPDTPKDWETRVKQTWDQYQQGLGPQPAKATDVLRKQKRSAIIKKAQSNDAPDPVARMVRETPVTDQVVDRPASDAFRDMGRLVAAQEAELQQLRAHNQFLTTQGQTAQQQAQQQIQQLQQQVQQLGSQAQQVGQVMAQAQQAQAQMGMQVSQATSAALAANQEAIQAGMGAFQARNELDQFKRSTQSWKEQVRQVLDNDPLTQEMQAQAAQEQAAQMQMAQMQQGMQQGQGQQQGVPQQQQQQQQQPQQQGMQVMASLGVKHAQARNDGELAVRMVMSKTALRIPSRAARPAAHALAKLMRWGGRHPVAVGAGIAGSALVARHLYQRHLEKKRRQQALGGAVPIRNDPEWYFQPGDLSGAWSAGVMAP